MALRDCLLFECPLHAPGGFPGRCSRDADRGPFVRLRLILSRKFEKLALFCRFPCTSACIKVPRSGGLSLVATLSIILYPRPLGTRASAGAIVLFRIARAWLVGPILPRPRSILHPAGNLFELSALLGRRLFQKVLRLAAKFFADLLPLMCIIATVLELPEFLGKPLKSASVGE